MISLHAQKQLEHAGRGIFTFPVNLFPNGIKWNNQRINQGNNKLTYIDVTQFMKIHNNKINEKIGNQIQSRFKISTGD